MRSSHKRTWALVILFCAMMVIRPSKASAVDSFQESFDSMQDNATIDGVNSWSVSSGKPTNAVTVSGVTFKGTGKSLELVGSLTPVKASRSASYGNLSPAWVEFVTKPGLGHQATAVPPGGIAAVSFNYTGDIMASDGLTWVKTGQKFSSGQWYHVMLKLDFSTHLYSVYVSPAGIDKTPFVPDKENLHFANPAINSISEFGFQGVYNETDPGNTFVDEVTINFVERLIFVSPLQTLVKNMPSNPITVQLQNSNSEPQTAWEDIPLVLQSSSLGGEFSLNKDPWVPITQVVVPTGAQQATFYYKDSTVGKSTISAKESPPRGWQTALQDLDIVAEQEFFKISVVSPQVAGSPFTVEIAAKDDQGNPNPLYQGTVNIFARYISPATGTKQITPVSATGFVNGVKNIIMSYPDCGLVEIVVEDNSDPSKGGKSGQVLFVPAEFSISADRATQIVSKPFLLNVNALNVNGEIALNYQGLALLQPAGISPPTVLGATLSPASLGSGQFQSGTAQVSSSYDRWGKIHIEVHDQTVPTQKGASETINFSPSSISWKVKPPPSGRDFFYTGETIEITLSVMDAGQTPIGNFAGVAKIDAESALNLPMEYVFSDVDHGQKTFTMSAAAPGSYIVKAELSENGLAAQTSPIEVKQASIEVISSVAPVGTTEVQIQLVDEKGKRITSENELPLQILFEEENPNSSVFLASPGKPVLFHKGIAKLIIGDTEAETVTITPKSEFGFKIKAGTVTFGRVGKGGIGTAMLWESKDE